MRVGTRRYRSRNGRSDQIVWRQRQWRAVFNYDGFRFESTEDAKKNAGDTAEKRVLVRTHTYMGHLGYLTAVLVVISDFDPSNLKVNHGVPGEVMTMFTSLDLVRDRLPPL